ncbi:putative ankyrin repeat-containing domain-containing protein [Helianthus anomalus]
MMNQRSTSSGHQQQQPQQNHTIVQMPQHHVSAAPAQQKPPQPNRPRLDLLRGNREEYIKFAVPLYEAAMKGDWKAAEPILSQHPHLIRFNKFILSIRVAITENEETLLHVAASAKSTKVVEQFVINLVQLMEKPDLELQNKNWDTALCSAADAGNIETAERMVKKNRALIETLNFNKVMPLYMAALFAKPKMVAYLYNLSNKMVEDCWTHDNRGWVLQKCVEADMFDVALNILNDCPNIVLPNRLLTDLLFALAQKPRAFEEEKPNSIFTKIKSTFAAPNKKESAALELLKIIWEKVAKMGKNDIDDIIRGPRSVKTNKEGKETIYFLLLLKWATRVL